MHDLLWSQRNRAFIERIFPQDGCNLILCMEAAKPCKSMFVHWNRNNFRASSARNLSLGRDLIALGHDRCSEMGKRDYCRTGGPVNTFSTSL